VNFLLEREEENGSFRGERERERERERPLIGEVRNMPRHRLEINTAFIVPAAFGLSTGI